MSQPDLDELERDVEQARARFADDLARLKSPRNLSAFKGDLWAEATQTKDELIEKTKEAAVAAVVEATAEGTATA